VIAHSAYTSKVQRSLDLKFFSITTLQDAKAMKEGIHPEYRAVVFQDVTTDFAILTKSTKKTKETVKWIDGETYPLIKIDVSSKSHPFYTGKHKTIESGGRVDKFRKRYAIKPADAAPAAESAPAA
jgi:large subunit ribosomal protein L31